MYRDYLEDAFRAVNKIDEWGDAEKIAKAEHCLKQYNEMLKKLASTLCDIADECNADDEGICEDE